MVAACVETLPLYRPRDPQASDLWRLLDQRFDCFQQVYDERFAAEYGFWRARVSSWNCRNWTWTGSRRAGRKPCSPCTSSEFTQHIPPTGSHRIRYYGWYSNKARRMLLWSALPRAAVRSWTSRLVIG